MTVQSKPYFQGGHDDHFEYLIYPKLFRSLHANTSRFSSIRQAALSVSKLNFKIIIGKDRFQLRFLFSCLLRNRVYKSFNTGFASGDFCRLLMTFANSLGPDQVRHVGPDLDVNCLTI